MSLFSLYGWTTVSPIKSGDSVFSISLPFFGLINALCVCVSACMCVHVLNRSTGLCLCLVISEGQPCCRLTRPHTHSTVNKIAERTLSLTHTCTCMHIQYAHKHMYTHIYLHMSYKMHVTSEKSQILTSAVSP